MKQNTGFTLVEILTAVVIISILVAMAAPLYNKTIERSRMAEARTILAKLQDAKLQAMDNMGCTDYNHTNANCPKLSHLNVAFVNEEAVDSNDLSFRTDDFRYSLRPYSTLLSPYSNAVCAERLGGGHAGTIFVYAAPGIVGDNSAAQFLCYDTNDTDCNAYGLEKYPDPLTCN